MRRALPLSLLGWGRDCLSLQKTAFLPKIFTQWPPFPLSLLTQSLGDFEVGWMSVLRLHLTQKSNLFQIPAESRFVILGPCYLRQRQITFYSQLTSGAAVGKAFCSL